MQIKKDVHSKRRSFFDYFTNDNNSFRFRFYSFYSAK